MKKIIEVDSKDEGLDGLLGEQVILFCQNYFYAGKLVGVNDQFVLLENGQIVYETGQFSAASWKLAEKVSDKLYITTQSIEAFAKGK